MMVNLGKMYLRLFVFCPAVLSRVVLVRTKNWIAVFCMIGWVADTIATNALRFFAESLQKLNNFLGFRSCPQNFGFLGPWQFCCSLSRGGFRGWVGGADAFFLRDSILVTEIHFGDGTFKISKRSFGANLY